MELFKSLIHSKNVIKQSLVLGALLAFFTEQVTFEQRLEG